MPEPEKTKLIENTLPAPYPQDSELVTISTRELPGQHATRPAIQDEPDPVDPPSSKEPVPATDQDAAQIAIVDLVARLHIDRTAIQVIEVTRQEFPLPDLGCPATGGKGQESPLPAIVFGQLVRLRANDLTYEYRIRGRVIRFCGGLPN